ncbi:MAG: hypothetical protein RLZZ66_1276 [Pseudomonadota bacterium]|jgi:outer membrane cobalamin receptor
MHHYKTTKYFFFILMSLSTQVQSNSDDINNSDNVNILSTMFIKNDIKSLNPSTAMYSSTVIEDELLENNQATDLNDILRSQSAISIRQSSAQVMTSLNIRGSGGAGQGMLTLDGIPLFGNFTGAYSLSHYPLDTLDQVLITRGNGDDWHGSRSLGGGIHLQTKKIGNQETLLHLEGGSYDTILGSIGHGASNNFGEFSGVAGHSSIFQGMSQAQNGNERDNYGMTHALGNWMKEFDKGSLFASFYYVRSDEDMDAPGYWKNRLAWTDNKQSYLSDETWVTQLKGHYAINQNFNTALQFGFTQDRQKMQTTLITPDYFAISNQLFLVDWRNTHSLYQNETSANHALIMWGVNAQYQQNLNYLAKQLIVSPNMRSEFVYGEWKLTIDNRLDTGNEFYGNHDVFSFGLSRSVYSKMKLYVNGGTGYRPPAVNELTHPLFGNDKLKAESSTGGEIGWHWNPSEDTVVKLNAYYQQYNNMIILQFDSMSGVVKAANEDSKVLGIELQNEHRWNLKWKSGFTYNYMNAVNPHNQLKTANRPEHQGSFWYEYSPTKRLSYHMEFVVHDNYWFDAPNKFEAGVAPRLNALMKYDLTPSTMLYLRGENITNNRTPEVNDFNFYGASFYVGLRSHF